MPISKIKSMNSYFTLQPLLYPLIIVCKKLHCSCLLLIKLNISKKLPICILSNTATPIYSCISDSHPTPRIQTLSVYNNSKTHYLFL